MGNVINNILNKYNVQVSKEVLEILVIVIPLIIFGVLVYFVANLLFRPFKKQKISKKKLTIKEEIKQQITETIEVDNSQVNTNISEIKIENEKQNDESEDDEQTVQISTIEEVDEMFNEIDNILATPKVIEKKPIVVQQNIVTKQVINVVEKVKVNEKQQQEVVIVHNNENLDKEDNNNKTD